ncbi:MAG: hypothetical protein U1F68_01190 [Gammaproteobacteria bacterium]
MTEIAALNPPASDTLEISLFGSGIGECVVVHLGCGEWMIVDSCRHAETKIPVALQYLQEIGVNVVSAVKLVVISHWHDDHIEGSTDVIKSCSEARVAFSGAMARDEFLKLTSLYASPNSILDKEKSGIREMGNILNILRQRQLGKLPGIYRPERLIQPDQVLYKSKHNIDCQVISLSPSDMAIRYIIQEFAALISQQDRLLLNRPKRNHNAVVIWVRFNGFRALLGSDLQETSDYYTGWSAVLASEWVPDGKAHIFKIPHHGSVNSHSDAVWAELVQSNSPIAILTTYNPSSLPRPSDVIRIRTKTDKIYCTTTPNRQPPRRERAVERTIKEVVKSRKILSRGTGQIQLRIPSSGEPTVSLFGHAVKL